MVERALELGIRRRWALSPITGCDVLGAIELLKLCTKAWQ